MKLLRNLFVIILLLQSAVALCQQPTELPWLGDYYAIDSTQPLNRDYPLAVGLNHLWTTVPSTFGRNFMPDLARGYTGTFNGIAAGYTSTSSGWNRSTRRGAFGELRLDGTNDFVDFGDKTAFDFANQKFTPSCWFKTSSSAVTQYVLVRRSDNGGGSVGGWHIRVNTSGVVHARLISAANDVTAERQTSATTATNGVWHHIAVVFTTNTTTAGSNDIQIYYDGSLNQGSLTTGATAYQGCTPAVELCNLRIGAASNTSPTEFFTGSVDQCMIHNRGLSAGEIYRLWNASSQSLPGFYNLLPFYGSYFQALAKRIRGRVF